MDLKLPELGENIAQGTVTKVLVKPGDAIKKGQNILELETDKAVLEVPASAEGVVTAVLVKVGELAKVGQAVLQLSSAAPVAPMPSVASANPANVQPAAMPAPTAKTASAPAIPPPGIATTGSPVHVPVRANIPAAPSVRLFAREIGVDLGQVPGTGPGGRISISDVKAFCKTLLSSGGTAGRTVAQPPLPNFAKFGHVRREPMNNVRKKTAEHLSFAWTSIPHVTQFDKADISQVEKLRKDMSSPERKISVTPFLIKAVAAALRKFPQFNASVDITANEIIYKEYINIGVAVDTDRGLLVPVLKNVDKMSIAQISDELVAAAERARNKKTTIEEMSGGCFTISNLGGIGGTFFTPIVNWPEVAILGVSRGFMEQVYADGNFAPKLMLPLSLSYDHRQIDGADGARFIRFMCQALEQPASIL